jgi:hypothetical protein
MATTNSTQVANTVAAPPVMNDANLWNGKMRFYEFDYTQSGIATIADTMAAIKLPAGKVRLVLPLCRIAFSAGGASSTMDVGWEAYTDSDGTTAVAADPNGLDDGIDTSGAGSSVLGGTVGGAETYLFDSLDGVTITLQINDTAFPDAGTLKGYFVAVME